MRGRRIDWLVSGESAVSSATERTQKVGKTKDIREAVDSELIFDPLVDATDITVKNMNGDVALNATVPNYPQYLEAAAAAQRVASVQNIHNHPPLPLPPPHSPHHPTPPPPATTAL